MSEKTWRYILYFSIIYSVIISIFFAFHISGLSLTNNNIENIFGLLIFGLPLFPFAWLHFLRARDWIKVLCYISYSIFFILYSVGAFLPFVFVSNDVFTWNNNGDRAVFEARLPDDSFLVLYRSYDQGALGGDRLEAAVVDKILPGVERRKWLGAEAIMRNPNTDTEYILVNGAKYTIPSRDVLYSKGYLD